MRTKCYIMKFSKKKWRSTANFFLDYLYGGGEWGEPGNYREKTKSVIAVGYYFASGLMPLNTRQFILLTM